MPSVRRYETKDGRAYYLIRVRRGREKSALSRRWYVPDGWSQRAIDRELAKVSAEFERQVQAGEVISRDEKRLQAAQEAAEAAKIVTLRQYGEKVFMPTCHHGITILYGGYRTDLMRTANIVLARL